MRLPPFGKPLRDLIQSGKRPDNSVYLWIGKNAWNKGYGSAKCRPYRTLVLPPFDDPKQYHWPVHECDILVFDTGDCTEGYIEALAINLFIANADIVRVIAPDFSYFATYKKDL